MSSSTQAGQFTVVVADNFHYMDESESLEHGRFETLEEAVAAAKAIVDACLASLRKPDMTAEQLYSAYVSFGEDPYIRGAAERVPFSAWTYAKERCVELCSQSGP